jgi:hypothetical integral membrane protein (TIGR02206 family)
MYPPDGWHHFSPFGGVHALMVIGCALVIAAPSLLGRRLSKTGEPVLRHALAGLAIIYWIAYATWWNWHRIDLREGLPLHICDINGLIAPYALLTQQRWARATLYFWTAALTSQAFIQPALYVGPASLVFWAFWAAHSILAACAVYDIVVLGFRPGWPDLGRAVLVSFAYGALVVPINAWLGADYGYLGDPAPDISVPPFVLMLGPWPLRAVVLAALVPLGFVVVLLPWLISWRPKPARS